jgi:uncharacterized protein (TIGR02266 family)
VTLHLRKSLPGADVFPMDQSSPGFAFRRGRAPLEIPVDLELSGESFVARSVNIGLGGLFVATDRRFHIGDRFNLRFTLPDQAQPIGVAAEVQWLYGHQGRALGVGLRFVGLLPAAAEAIREFLRSFDNDLPA